MSDHAAEISVDVNGMNEYPVVLCESFKASRRIGIIGSFGYVDVHPDTVLGGQCGSPFESFVGTREGGVNTNHSVGAR